MGVSLNHRSIQPVTNYTFHLAKKGKDEEVKAPNLYLYTKGLSQKEEWMMKIKEESQTKRQKVHNNQGMMAEGDRSPG
jgi:hypothetical protein